MILKILVLNFIVSAFNAVAETDSYIRVLRNFTDEPTASPTIEPTQAPTLEPTQSPTEPCLIFEVEVETDDYGGETSFSLMDEDKNIYLSEGPFESSESYDFSTCLPDGRYKFVIFDSDGDGMCCENGKGSYKLLLNGSTLTPTNGKFEYFKMHPFKVELDVPECKEKGDECKSSDECCSNKCKGDWSRKGSAESARGRTERVCH